MPIQVSLLNIIFLSVQRIIVKNLGSSLWLHAGLPLHCHFLAHPENYCCRKSWILVMTLIFKPISWLKYLGRNRRRYWCGALQLRLWKHDHVRPGSLTFWLIYEVSKLLTIFITDHISPHTHRRRLPATVPRTRCPVTRFTITVQDNSMFDKCGSGEI